MKNRMNEFLLSKSYIDMKAVAADLAAADAEDQAFFFNIFFEALEVNCEDKYRYQMQMSYILKECKDKTKEGFNFLGQEDD